MEFAFSLEKPISEFERDVFKRLLAQEAGHPVRKLLLVSKPGGEARTASPGPKAIKEWVLRKYGLQVDVRELVPPEPGCST